MQTKCVFCEKPLQVQVQAGDSGNPEDVEAGYPCACTVARQSGVLMRCTLRKALYRAPELRRFLYSAATLPEACIFSYRGGDFPDIVPKKFHRSGLWVVRLPAILEPRLVELAITRLEHWTVYSADFLRASSHIGWRLPELEVHFPLYGFDHMLPGREERPCVLFLFLCAGSAVLTVNPVDERFLNSLQLRGLSTDASFHRPSRDWTKDDPKSTDEEDPPDAPAFLQFFDDGTLDLELRGYVPGMHEASDMELD